jgi:hypothetical protein
MVHEGLKQSLVIPLYIDGGFTNPIISLQPQINFVGRK